MNRSKVEERGRCYLNHMFVDPQSLIVCFVFSCQLCCLVNFALCANFVTIPGTCSVCISVLLTIIFIIRYTGRLLCFSTS